MTRPCTRRSHQRQHVTVKSDPQPLPGVLAAGTAGKAESCGAGPVPSCPGWARAGIAVEFRSPARSDLPGITAMWERCSLATRMARFHAPVRRIPASYLAVAASDPAASLVAVPRNSAAVAALASLVPGDGDCAELGVLVEDAWQRHGIGRQLVARLIAAARARQITELTASVFAQNVQIADLLRQIPGEFSVTRDGTTLSVRVRLAPEQPG